MYKLLRNKILWFFIVLLLAAAGLLAFGASGYTERQGVGPLQIVFNPLHKAALGLKDGLGSFTSIFSNKKTLQAQNEQLQQQLDSLKLENQSLKEYRSEAERLQKLLNFKNNNAATLQLKGARVIARSPDNWYKNLWIDRGSDDGVTRGMPIISPDGLVGRVDKVNSRSAQVILISDREIAVGAILEKNRETNGLVEGYGNNTYLRMIDIPFYSKIELNDLVVTSDLSASYPKGIPIGTVVEINKEPGGLLLNAVLKPAVDFDRLEEVLIIMSYRPPDPKQVAKR